MKEFFSIKFVGFLLIKGILCFVITISHLIVNIKINIEFYHKLLHM